MSAGLREADQDPSSSEGGHASIASEQQYVFLSRKGDKPLLVGQYVVVIHADMGQPLVHVQVGGDIASGTGTCCPQSVSQNTVSYLSHIQCTLVHVVLCNALFC